MDRTPSPVAPSVVYNKSDGLPKLEKHEQAREGWRGCRNVVALLVLPRLGALGVSCLLYHFGDKSFYDSMFEFFNEFSDTKLGYLFIVVALFSFLISWLNTVPLVHKARVLTTASSNLRANPYLYKVNSHRSSMPPVILEEDGPVGEYNRANRSLHHFVEWSTAVAITMPFAGSVFPLPVLVLTVLFAMGRIWHQVGYSHEGYGSHVGGFYIATLSSAVIEMLAFVCGYMILSSYCPHCNHTTPKPTLAPIR
mmetsp:Transcript_56037/g.126444  ORF Transcript_56037/g.126444 Transcript_56037/m.126444 type:complete len:252 (-) Transcript_56037:92-847(-)